MKQTVLKIVSTAWIVFGLSVLFWGERALLVVFKIFPGGLEVCYYKGLEFNRCVASRTERKVEKGYSKYAPTWRVPKETFSAIWKGFIKIPEDNEYLFKLLSDDGSRLFINQQLVIDHWGEHYFIPKTGRIFLKKGKYPIRIEYFNKGPVGKIRLKWYTKNNDIVALGVLGVPYLSKR